MNEGELASGPTSNTINTQPLLSNLVVSILIFKIFLNKKKKTEFVTDSVTDSLDY